MSRRLLCGLLALAFVATGERSADTRQCGRIVPPCQEYWESETVFVGTVRHEEPDFAAHGTRDLGPMVGLTIRLQGNGLEREVSTANNGAFDFGGLLPGEYTLSLRPPGRMLLNARLYGVYSTPAPGSFTVTLRYARGCMPISFTVREPGGIRGVLLDDRGAPVEGGLVSAIAAVNAGTSQHVSVERVRTGADGRFEFTPLPRGQYVLVLNLDDRHESTEFNRRVYHPGTRVPGEATIVTVDRPTIVDAGAFRVPPDPVERTITGVVVWSDGVPASDAELVLHGAAPERVPLDAAGRFRVTLPYGARFTLQALGRREVNGRMRESLDVPYSRISNLRASG